MNGKIALLFMDCSTVFILQELYSQLYQKVGVLFVNIPDLCNYYVQQEASGKAQETIRALNEIIMEYDEVGASSYYYYYYFYYYYYYYCCSCCCCCNCYSCLMVGTVPVFISTCIIMTFKVALQSLRS